MLIVLGVDFSVVGGMRGVLVLVDILESGLICG